jgi:hypothetical protein
MLFAKATSLRSGQELKSSDLNAFEAIAFPSLYEYYDINVVLNVCTFESTLKIEIEKRFSSTLKSLYLRCRM